MYRRLRMLRVWKRQRRQARSALLSTEQHWKAFQNDRKLFQHLTQILLHIFLTWDIGKSMGFSYTVKKTQCACHVAAPYCCLQSMAQINGI
ncbi:hypothetical protein EV356DRAFT_509777 [Viridothelium virens]|uniref:Uncharacterized protein n=1 Tax=Viridothelium virens TaxID=1048519 RepID=A0A6A6HK34_VIRVR|nr:hypothetical protein EV356DRAFT_509777 [Viridothelium virens]